jgi:hypothetical protein
VERTVALFTIRPAAVVWTTIFTCWIAPGRSVPRKQLRTLVPEHMPFVDSAETNVTRAGNRSRTTTPYARCGPKLRTVSVYVRFEPTAVACDDTAMRTVMLACGGKAPRRVGER